MTAPPINFYDLPRGELRRLAARWGFSPVHAARLWRYAYLEGATAPAVMPALPARYRARLEQELVFPQLPVAVESHSTDGFTRKYLLALGDGRRIETVLMRFTGRVTACLSSQAGCAMGCVFCATGQMGFVRHLTPGEIVLQALHVQRELRTLDGPAGGRLRNVVLMGMGEPLHNYDAVVRAAEILRDPSGFSLSPDRITLSTVGVVPGIRRLAAERQPIHLAVSLHAATQAERAALVPVAKKWPLDELMDACREYSARTGRRIFYEWALIAGKNDSADQAHAVGRLLAGLHAQVNLIPLNPTGGYAGTPTDRETARRFQDVLLGYKLPSTVRLRRGIDIAAGCGQLAGAA